TSLFRVRYDGTLVDEEGFCAIGGQEDELTAHMKERYEGGMDLRATIRFATEAFEAVEEREIGPDEWEAAVLDRTNGRRMFRRLDAGEITAARS
ncbi:MAG: proteasome subunit alpha, partial [Acidimicrobiia bacterium]|nr:proteasome subunit alpha [Acidimicrobiia bacterium]